jgi:transcription factor C subunit 3
MSGDEGVIDWNIVKKVYGNDKFFRADSAQKLWTWMQSNMVPQVSELSADFQSLFLEAYEAGRISAIEDPDTYDWPNLIQWVVRKCSYPEIPLPMLREALRQFTVDESNYENLDRVSWYKAAVADRTRTLLQLQQSFTAPLHRSREATWSPQDKALKARSWIRSNTATSQDLYDATLAHGKFKELGESVLVSVVGDFVQKQHLRMRKTKRLLPGRNYSFTKRFAKKYTRLFQLSDFLDAVEVKKNMDAAFESEDPTKRYYNISRCEEDGSFAAIMNMVSEGTVKLAPQLPPVNSEFGAPLPRISVWGFCEGDYIHRAIDRERLFWDVHVVPTATYRCGNPLQPLPASPTDKDKPAVWPMLPGPPLPGKHDAGALLPIWSSIDGQSITWPWWYRILNLVLQPLIFIAGATAAEVHSHCPEDTAELFEIELVLGWLESINAVKKTVGGGYITLPGFWASFGDRLLDTEDDWFGEHVKRKSKNHEKQEWRTEYNLRHSTLQTRNAEQTQVAPEEDAQDDANAQDIGTAESSTGQEILKNPKQQYRITKMALDTRQSPGEKDGPVPAPAPAGSPVAMQAQTQQDAVAEQLRVNISQTTETTNTPGPDIDMADVDADADADVDAEGEIDDDLY